jgi:quinol-cytochrome oxidoreductase complex cytochrome b subunit
MKKTKRIFALIGVVLLLSLYIMTFIGALTASPNSSALFRASIYSTIVVPILLYAYMLIYRLIKKDSKDKPPMK